MGGDLPAYLDKLIAGFHACRAGSSPPAIFTPLSCDFRTKVAGYSGGLQHRDSSEISVAKALMGEIPITGHLPVTIPNFAQYGDGIHFQLKLDPLRQRIEVTIQRGLSFCAGSLCVSRSAANLRPLHKVLNRSAYVLHLILPYGSRD